MLPIFCLVAATQQPAAWTVASGYEDSASITAVVRLDGVIQLTGILAAFINGTVRGVTHTPEPVPDVPVFGEMKGKSVFALSVHIDQVDEGATVTFMFSPDGVHTAALTTVTTVSINEIKGSLEDPVPLAGPAVVIGAVPPSPPSACPDACTAELLTNDKCDFQCDHPACRYDAYQCSEKPKAPPPPPPPPPLNAAIQPPAAWTVASGYEDSASITAVVRLDGVIQLTGILAAFINGTVRGVTHTPEPVPDVPVFGEMKGKSVFALSVHIDQVDEGATVTFMFSPDGVHTAALTTVTTVSINEIKGSLEDPVPLAGPAVVIGAVPPSPPSACPDACTAELLTNDKCDFQCDHPACRYDAYQCSEKPKAPPPPHPPGYAPTPPPPPPPPPSPPPPPPSSPYVLYTAAVHAKYTERAHAFGTGFFVGTIVGLVIVMIAFMAYSFYRHHNRRDAHPLVTHLMSVPPDPRTLAARRPTVGAALEMETAPGRKRQNTTHM